MEFSKTVQKMPGAPARSDRDKTLSRPDKVKGVLAAVLALIVLVTGCVSIPAEDWVVSYRSPFELTKQAAGCETMGPAQPAWRQTGSFRKIMPPMAQEDGLNADGFSFATWNIHKGTAEGWSEDFQKLCGSTDILVLQEALLTDNLIQMLRQENYQWDLSAAYAFQNVETGVLTASKILPSLACTLKDKEPITRVPKSVLVTRYPMSGTDRTLLVANIHAINFSLGHSAFQKQCDRLESLLSGHKGPMIVSGDFNTWSNGRMSRVNAMAERLELEAVSFNKNLKSKFFGHYVDHIFYRGLEKKDAEISLVTTSDHNPLSVVFKLANESDPDI